MASQAFAATNAASRGAGAAASVADPNDPVERDYQKLLEEDDGAQTEVDQWIRAREASPDQAVSQASLKFRIEQRFEPVRKAYENFLYQHPNHSRARLAFGSFLNDTGKEKEAMEQWEKVRVQDPKNPAAWNNLANCFGHNGPVTNAFIYYAKASELNPSASLYYYNLGKTIYLFRQDAMAHFKLSDAQVLDKAINLYRKALELDPGNFLIASDLAQSYYGLERPNTGDAAADRKAVQKITDEALAAWKMAHQLARDDIEREGVRIHYARLQINAGRLDEARKNLDAVTNAIYADTKGRLLRKLEGNAPAATNAPPSKP
jgi:tetratricopeptide (TPR) repeat protein